MGGSSSSGASKVALEERGQLLVYGYGNPARQDDALGVCFAERCESEFVGRSGYRVETNYQLNVEDAELISRFREVVFVDAAVPDHPPAASMIDAGDEEAGFFFYRITPVNTISFSTHAMDPESVLGLCDELFGRVPECRVMRIIGYEWEFDALPSPRALANLDNAWSYFVDYLVSGRASRKKRQSRSM